MRKNGHLRSGSQRQHTKRKIVHKLLQAKFISIVVVSAFVVGLLANSAAHAETPKLTLTLAAFAVSREAYAAIIPEFEAHWLQEKGKEITFQESYQASGAQSRAVIGGLQADVVALSLETDVTRIAKAGLITHTWQEIPNKGFVSSSVVVLVVRTGNPKNIRDWADLARDGIEVITPNPATSGGAQWNFLAVFGAAKRGQIEGVAKDDEAAALEFLGKIIANISVFDKDGRESFLTFESGIGDVAITYENEYYAGIAAGGDYEIIYPQSSILIENPTTYVDVYAQANGGEPQLEAAKAFVEYLVSAEAQRIFAAKGFRPVVADVLAEPEIAELFPVLEDQFTIAEFGSWPVVGKNLFGEAGKISQLITRIKGS
jgi:sulfate/thiosulfate transport system substrate-binding protein